MPDPSPQVVASQVGNHLHHRMPQLGVSRGDQDPPCVLQSGRPRAPAGTCGTMYLRHRAGLEARGATLRGPVPVPASSSAFEMTWLSLP